MVRLIGPGGAAELMGERLRKLLPAGHQGHRVALAGEAAGNGGPVSGPDADHSANLFRHGAFVPVADTQGRSLLGLPRAMDVPGRPRAPVLEGQPREALLTDSARGLDPGSRIIRYAADLVLSSTAGRIEDGAALRPRPDEEARETSVVSGDGRRPSKHSSVAPAPPTGTRGHRRQVV